ncbi:metallophosphoesterase family protein [Paenibacillus beijingensis]|uniref:Serine/threonine protein phosphatase n=1 Tax=Paenibacillus beijingensis TaxID=1126833 RepID=A0A0D5NQ00_9BACL|nr:metallophosphoesterase family protein [Paenibacillus beijingensis]AJY77389.1 serine/threonine protein phosphatase [Paenibacillus beijingensis]
MERIAVISDIHGNLPALQAVLQDIAARGIGRIFCLGDLAGKGPGSAEAVDLIRSSCEIVVRGNWDDFIGKPTDNPALIWHQQLLGAERLHYLSSLPFSTEFIMSGRLVRLFHASQVSVYKRVQPWDAYEERFAMFNALAEGGPAADVIGYGDIHNAYVQHFEGRTLFNSGSVGNPLEIPQASYAIIEGEWEVREAAAFSIQLLRIPYDIEAAVRLAVEAGMPDLDPYVMELRTARYRGLHK